MLRHFKVVKQRKIALFLLLPLFFSLFLSIGYFTVAQTDTAVLSMNGASWSIKVDSILQTDLDSKAAPYVSVQKAGTEKELFLTLNSLKDCVSGEIQFKVSTTGLTVYKQLPLTEDLKITQLIEGQQYALLNDNVYPPEYDFINSTHAMLKGEVKVYRPENVVNSFACFDDSGRKVLHIYASKLIDAKGNSVWVDSDLKDGLLTVYLDQKWLAEVVFPVVVDPTFGYTDVGATHYDEVTNTRYGVFVTSTEVGTAINLYIYTSDDQASTYKLGLYYATSGSSVGALKAESAAFTVSTAGWYNATINYAVTARDYFVAPIADGGTCTYSDTVTNAGAYSGDVAYPTFPTSWTLLNQKHSMYVEYTTEETTTNTINSTLSQPANDSTVNAWLCYFNYTATLQGTDKFYGASLYLNGTQADGNNTAIVNGTLNSISHLFTTNGTYVWDIKLSNSTTSVWSDNGNFTVHVAVYEAAATPTPTSAPSTDTLNATTVNYLVLVAVTLALTVLAFVVQDMVWLMLLRFSAGLFWMILGIAIFIFSATDTFVLLGLPFALFGLLFWITMIRDFLKEKHGKPFLFED